MSISAYGRLQNRVESQRQVEYRLLGQVTGALMNAKTAGDKRKYFDAVLWNQRVWDAFFHDVMDSGNRLPPELKRLITTLYWTIRDETDRLIAGRGDLDTLITVNRNIMEGLR